MSASAEVRDVAALFHLDSDLWVAGKLPDSPRSTQINCIKANGERLVYPRPAKIGWLNSDSFIRTADGFYVLGSARGLARVKAE